MIGLALEGGGVRGSYQAGVYMAMYEAGIKFDGVCGTSIGALNGAVIASGHGEDLPKIWRSLSMGQVFGFSEEFTKLVNEKIVNLDFFKLTIANIIRILGNKGIELKGLKEVLDNYLNIDDLLKSEIDFGICTVRFKDLQPLYLFKEDMNKEKIKDYILASSFLPFFKREKLIDNNYYLDGGFYDLGPVNMLLNKGYQKVYLVKVHGIGISRPYDSSKVVVIESKRNLGKVMDLDPKRIDENVKMGYYDAIRVLKNYDGEKFVFKRHSEKYYRKLNRKVNEKTYKRVKDFFKSDSYKDTTIRAMEYIMEHESINYYKIYNFRKILRFVKKKEVKKHFIYDYVRKLKTYY